jgi:peptidoglycan/xylan/chitin deacetylase (PgdA/CDA1 family)
MATKRVTLTFDNGPTPGVTDRVLTLLDRAGIKTTFFVIGQKLDEPAAADLMRAAHAAGHWIANHTFTHSVALGDRPDRDHAVREIEETQRRIGSLARPEKLFRPYGNSGLIGRHLLSRAALQHLLAHRYTTVTWNSVPGDWKDAEGWVETALAQVRGQDWSVVVLHDIEMGCLARLPELIQRLTDWGATFEQTFPSTVILTEAGRTVSMSPAFIAD